MGVSISNKIMRVGNKKDGAQEWITPITNLGKWDWCNLLNGTTHDKQASMFALLIDVQINYNISVTGWVQ